jgi:hypothetical protein
MAGQGKGVLRCNKNAQIAQKPAFHSKFISAVDFVVIARGDVEELFVALLANALISTIAHG